MLKGLGGECRWEGAPGARLVIGIEVERERSRFSGVGREGGEFIRCIHCACCKILGNMHGRRRIDGGFLSLLNKGVVGTWANRIERSASRPVFFPPQNRRKALSTAFFVSRIDGKGNENCRV